MATSFFFDANTPQTAGYLPLAAFTFGDAPGQNTPREASAYAGSQAIDFSGDVDVVAVTLVAGSRYTFDIDGGAGDASGGSIDLELDLIDSRGNLVLSSSGSNGTDPGTFSPLDPILIVDVRVTGTYFIAVHSEADSYINGFFDFTRGGGGTGDYSLVVSTASLAPITFLTAGNDARFFSDAAQNVRGLGGDDRLSMNGGNDVASGGLGNDTVDGGAGDDELNGDAGFDDLRGGDGADVLNGGAASDVLNGGAGNDALNGSLGNDALLGSFGNDSLWGDSGNDVIRAGDGDDFLRGGLGADTLYGMGGADTFHFLPGESAFDVDPPITTEDRILDFQTIDALDLADLALGTLAFRGSSFFSGANQVRVVDLRDAAGNGYQEVRVNLDGNTSTVELAFLVDTAGNFTLNASDFVL